MTSRGCFGAGESWRQKSRWAPGQTSEGRQIGSMCCCFPETTRILVWTQQHPARCVYWKTMSSHLARRFHVLSPTSETSYLRDERSWRMDWARIRKQDGIKYSTVWLNWQHVEIVPLCQHKGGRQGKRRRVSFHVIHHSKLPFLHRS